MLSAVSGNRAALLTSAVPCHIAHDFRLSVLKSKKPKHPQHQVVCELPGHDEQIPEQRARMSQDRYLQVVNGIVYTQPPPHPRRTTDSPISYRPYCLRWTCVVGMKSTSRGQWVIGVVCSTPATFEHPGSIMQGRGGCLLSWRYRKLTSVDRAARLREACERSLIRPSCHLLPRCSCTSCSA